MKAPATTLFATRCLAFERREETHAMAIAGWLDVERRDRWSIAVDTLLGVLR